MWVPAILTSRSDIRATKDLPWARPTTSMKKGWLCRTSYDDIAHTWWWPGEIQIQLWWLREIQIEWWSRSSSDDPDRVMIQILSREMIQIEWWSRSSPVMLIQIEWWSRSSDAILWWFRSRDDPDQDDLKMKMTQMIQLMQRRRPVLKNCVERIPS